MTARSYTQEELDTALALERERIIARARDLAASHRAVARLPAKPKQMDAAEALDELVDEIVAARPGHDHARASLDTDDAPAAVVLRAIETYYADWEPLARALGIRAQDIRRAIAHFLDRPHPLETQIAALTEQIDTVTSQHLAERQGLQAKVDRLCGALDCFTLPKRRMNGGYWKYDHDFRGNDDDEQCHECGDERCEHEWAKQREMLVGDSPDRPHRLTWTGVEWVAPCGCRYHPDDDKGTHGGAPHLHRCKKHYVAPAGDISEAIAALTLARIESPEQDCDAYIAKALRVLQRIVDAGSTTGRPTGEYRETFVVERDMDGEAAVTLSDGTHVYQAEAIPWRGGIAINPRGDKRARVVVPWDALQVVAFGPVPARGESYSRPRGSAPVHRSPSAGRPTEEGTLANIRDLAIRMHAKVEKEEKRGHSFGVSLDLVDCWADELDRLAAPGADHGGPPSVLVQLADRDAAREAEREAARRRVSGDHGGSERAEPTERELYGSEGLPDGWHWSAQNNNGEWTAKSDDEETCIYPVADGLWCYPSADASKYPEVCDAIRKRNGKNYPIAVHAREGSSSPEGNAPTEGSDTNV